MKGKFNKYEKRAPLWGANIKKVPIAKEQVMCEEGSSLSLR